MYQRNQRKAQRDSESRFVRRLCLAAACAAALQPCFGQAAAPTGTIQDVQHVVILMQENRSFDHYFGSLRGVRGFNDPNPLLFPNGSNSFCQPWGTNYVLPFRVTEQCLMDVDHDETSVLDAWDGGKWDQWANTKSPRTMACYARSDLPFYYALAEAYTICDEYHCSFFGPTFPNRLYLMTGTIDPNGTAGGPVKDNNSPAGGLHWTTYPERLQAAGISWRVYQQSNDFPAFNPLGWFPTYGPPGVLHDRITLVSDLVNVFRAEVASNTLPKVSWLLPPWSCSEHPYLSPANGQHLVKQLLDALAANPDVYNSTVFILTYDEDGGFFDHVPPPAPPPGTPNEFINGQPCGLGVRVPTILVSPWSRGGYVVSEVFDHTSVIRFLETWTGVQEPNLSAWRRQVCGDLTSAFDFTNPNTNYPSLPDVAPLNCTDPQAAYPPDPQAMPVQETGTNLTRPRPYSPNAFSVADCGATLVGITMTNAGSASTHFMIFANAFRADGPWQYDVAAHSALTAYFSVAQSGGAYDLTCYGPHRFHRRFTGNINDNCDQLEVTASVDPTTSGVMLALRNSSAAAVTFTVTNLIQAGGAATYTVPPGTTDTETFLTATESSTGYSLVAAIAGQTTFLRTFTGDGDSAAPPAGTNAPPKVTGLTAKVSGPNLVLAYPAGASSYTLECSTNLAPNSWIPVTTPPTLSGGNLYVTIPMTASRMFFRLGP